MTGGTDSHAVHRLRDWSTGGFAGGPHSSTSPAEHPAMVGCSTLSVLMQKDLGSSSALENCWGLKYGFGVMLAVTRRVVPRNQRSGAGKTEDVTAAAAAAAGPGPVSGCPAAVAETGVDCTVASAAVGTWGKGLPGQHLEL